jgi:hypothetical protein
MRVELITPKKANEMLKNMVPNRPVKNRLVDQYADDMRNGRWEINGETIKVDSEGRTIDGQHRLLACVRTGRAFHSYVARGLDPERAIRSIDTGRSRSLGDFFHFEGVPNALHVAAGLKVLHNIATNQPVRSAGYKMRCEGSMDSRSRMAEYLQKHPHAIASTQFTRKFVYDTKGWLPMSLLCGLHIYLTKLVGKDLANEFAESVATGAELPRTSPLYKLREKLRQDALKPHSKMRESAKLILLVRAWNFWVTNTEVKSVRGLQVGSKLDMPVVLQPGDRAAKQRHTQAVQVRVKKKKKKARAQR